MMVKYTTKTVLIIAVLASLVSFAKFEHCRTYGWGAPDVYVHACYSDLSALYGDRGLNHHQWPYSSPTKSVEYPPGTAMVMYATSWLVPHPENGFRFYFDINALFIALIFVGTVLLIGKMNPQYWYLLPISPAVVASLYINWDIWAVISAIAAIYFFDRKRMGISALLLGLSIATKFFPIVLLIPIVLIFYRKLQIANLIRYVALTGASWLILNLPFIITTPVGWWRFFKLNGQRGADFGSLWYGLQLFGINIKGVNTFSILLFLIGTAGFTYYFFLRHRIPTLAQSAFLIVAVFTCASKVYSPQYVLWLTPLAVLALHQSRLRRDFWIWQAGEAIYHVAIWQYLASYTGTHFGLPPKVYAVSIFLRIAVTLWFAGRLISTLSTREIDTQDPKFLPIAADGYA
jgi:uncharacterized membrane protein